MKLTSAALHALREGSLSFEQFARDTRVDFRNLAWKLMTSRPKDELAPVWLSWDDLTQDMLMDVPDAVRRWRPEVGLGLKPYVVYRVCTHARKAMERARKGRHLEQDQTPEEERDLEALQERVVMAQQLMVALPQTELQAVVMETMLRTQSIAKTTSELARDPRTMRAFAVADDIASKKIRRVMVLLAQRAATAR